MEIVLAIPLAFFFLVSVRSLYHRLIALQFWEFDRDILQRKQTTSYAWIAIKHALNLIDLVKQITHKQTQLSEKVKSIAFWIIIITSFSLFSDETCCFQSWNENENQSAINFNIFSQLWHEMVWQYGTYSVAFFFPTAVWIRRAKRKGKIAKRNGNTSNCQLNVMAIFRIDYICFFPWREKKRIEI